MGGCLYEPAFAFMTRALGIHATRAITLVTLLGGLAGSISFPIGHYVSLAASWHAACLVYAALLFIAAPLLWFGAHHLERSIAAGDEADEAMPAPASGAHLRSARFWMLAAGFTLLAVNHGVVLNHILPLLAERGFDAATAVFAASMIGPMQVAGRIAVMFAAGRMPNRAIMMGCFTGIALATVLLIGSASLPLLIAGFVTLQGASYGVLSIIKPVVTREVMGGRNFGAISGTMAVPYLLGVAVAPFLGALVWQAGGYDLVLTAILGAALTGGLIAFGATRRTR
jgi:predicted MFS family arabinose efflux permease